MQFITAKTKLEAVERLARLTNSPPEWLGPGSKEHKSVLINLAIGLGVSFSHTLTKQQLAEHIANRLGGRWQANYQSVGQTITLEGLNLLLRLAESELANNPLESTNPIADAFESELAAITSVTMAHTPRFMDGRACVEEMQMAGDPNWKQVQWQGFYFEMKASNALTEALGGGRQKLFNTTFDYVRNFIWDLKAHSAQNERGKPSYECILNDARAIEKAAEETGLGFIVLTGDAHYDREFTRWHKNFRGGGEAEPGRTLKSSFTPTKLDVFFAPDLRRLRLAEARKELSITAQGKNSNGKARPPKYSLNLRRAEGSDLQVFSREF